jgi:hypothetical protein
MTWKLLGDTRPEVNMNASKSLHFQPGNTSTIDAITETCDDLQDHLTICHRGGMQLVYNMSSFKFIISVFMFYDFPFQVNMRGEQDEGFDIYNAAEELKEEKVLYLVKCRKNEFEKALTNVTNPVSLPSFCGL